MEAGTEPKHARKARASGRRAQQAARRGKEGLKSADRGRRRLALVVRREVGEVPVAAQVLQRQRVQQREQVQRAALELQALRVAGQLARVILALRFTALRGSRAASVRRVGVKRERLRAGICVHVKAGGGSTLR